MTSINATRALIGTVPEATRAGFWTQPGLLNPRIRHAYRNHSDYPMRITMQMLVNSRVSARSALPPSPTPPRLSRAETMHPIISPIHIHSSRSLILRFALLGPIPVHFIERKRYRRRFRIRQAASVDRTCYLINIPWLPCAK